ncbi:MAG: lipocalin [Flavobacteriaceae bacterium CG_4_8_14_3_um_filter_34_10]|nr:MAG: lipocalin [Flavobacteriaceae bacterium CG2_30_34_30]PIQ17739.1 MAG: lipocalin [Flavobacteriaceae bacterium CG18_big_fil_WC_8_21_14_2_50_34_36]PIV51469.1 MAG: lipocalin [Flavobacteriaceae bacterium CG02_land_8_20_14_3_00_34_13]PIX09972.1 MAG: lipocalin [Flavobacteriaceae bacterium CG_4_8_14_3_um_filter_34_10]PIZ07741.1 MAG: lipocalin [Flavobacteriaceae bacterium CG_4_10_14_0_8_um_filter_34_31]PJC06469.1 MAG: lipocalin [Flavobacteriaceae bacterium CG_4_9_14_0_8_um_filter_34_30]
MKKLIVLFTVAAMLLACGTPKEVKDSKKIIKGEWTINSITYSESGSYSVTIFNDVSKDCFENSTWRFIPNNNTGKYTINSAGCSMGERNFIFTIDQVDASTGLYDFLLKPTDERGRSETNQGFRVRLAQLNDTNMVWEQNLTVDGKPFTIFMNFNKLN